MCNRDRGKDHPAMHSLFSIVFLRPPPKFNPFNKYLLLPPKKIVFCTLKCH